VTWRKFSPDGTKLAVLGAGELWVVPYPPKSEARKIPTLGSITGVSWLGNDRLVFSEEINAKRQFKIVTAAVNGGAEQTVFVSPQLVLDTSGSSDGKRIAYTTGSVEWDVLEVSLSNGALHTMLAGGGLSLFPDWAPSGTHYLVYTDRSGSFNIEDITPGGFSRRLIAPPEADLGAVMPRWSPDGNRLMFGSVSADLKAKLMVANAAGGGAITVMDLPPNQPMQRSWSPDGQWLVAATTGKTQELVKIKPTSGATPIPIPNAKPFPGSYDSAEWSPAGDWILYPADGMYLVSPEGENAHKLTSHRFSASAFSKDGRTVYGIFRNTMGEGPEWLLYSVDVKTGAEKIIGPVDLPGSTNAVAGFSIHPDGKRALISIAKWPFDIWMLEGFNQQPRNWLERIFRR
jgi:hypothetical protein